MLAAAFRMARARAAGFARRAARGGASLSRPAAAGAAAAAALVASASAAVLLRDDGDTARAEAEGARDQWYHRIWVPWAASWDPLDFLEDEDHPDMTVEERREAVRRNNDRVARHRAGLSKDDKLREDRALMPFTGYLPPWTDGERDRYKYTLVLGFEECAVDGVFGNPLEFMDIADPSEIPALTAAKYEKRRVRQAQYDKTEGHMYRRRRGLLNMLMRLSSAGYEIVMLSGRGAHYVVPPFSALDNHALCKWLVVGEQLRMTGGKVDLEEMNRDLRRLVYVNTRHMVAGLPPAQKSNCMSVTPFRYVDPADDALVPVTIFLEMLAAMNVDDVRPYLERMQADKRASWRQVFGDEMMNRVPSSRVLDQHKDASGERRRHLDPAMAERLRNEVETEVGLEYLEMHERLTPRMLIDPTKETPESVATRSRLRRNANDRRRRREAQGQEEDQKWDIFGTAATAPDEEALRQKAYHDHQLELDYIDRVSKLGTGEGLLLGGKPYARIDAQHLYEERRLENERRRALASRHAGVAVDAEPEELADHQVAKDWAKVAPRAHADDLQWMLADADVHEQLMWRYEHEKDERVAARNLTGPVLRKFKHTLRGVPTPEYPPEEDIFDGHGGRNAAPEAIEAIRRHDQRVKDLEELRAAAPHPPSRPREAELFPEATPAAAVAEAQRTPRGSKRGIGQRETEEPVIMAPPTLIGLRIANEGPGKFNLDSIVAHAAQQDTRIFEDTRPVAESTTDDAYASFFNQ